MPCHSDRVPNRLAFSSATNRRVSSGSWASPWQRICQLRQLLAGRARRRSRRLAARRTARASARRRPRPARRSRRAPRRRARPVRAAAASGPRRGCPACGSRRANRRPAPARVRVRRPRRRRRAGRPTTGSSGRRRPLARRSPSVPATAVKSPPSFRVAEVSTVVLLAEDPRPHQAGHRQRRDPGLAPVALPVGHPDHVVLAQRRHPLGDVEHLLDRGRGLPPLGVGLVRRRSGRSPPGGPPSVPLAGRDDGASRDPRPAPAVRPSKRRRRTSADSSSSSASVVVQPGQGTPTHPLDELWAQLGRGRPGHPGHQLVRLVDDHRRRARAVRSRRAWRRWPAARGW